MRLNDLPSAKTAAIVAQEVTRGCPTASFAKVGKSFNSRV